MLRNTAGSRSVIEYGLGIIGSATNTGHFEKSHDLVEQVLYRQNEPTEEGAKQVEVTSRRKAKTS